MNELGGFILERPLGRGATAQVYLATRKTDRSQVALKVFHAGILDPLDLKRRASTEVQAILSLRHPNIVGILEAFLEFEPPAMALEYVDGVSLEEFQSRLPYILPEVSVLIVIEILSALEMAHRNGIIHRDLKPANILIGKDGRVRVTDFGLAKLPNVARMTMSGTVLGSPDYMSPEQARGEQATPESDLYSAAAILYFLVTGTRPFSRPSLLATIAAVNDSDPEPPQSRNPKLSLGLARIVLRGLSKKREDRFPSAEEFKRALLGHLSRLGLISSEFALVTWIENPAEITLNSLNRISAALTIECEKQIGARQMGAALETLSHISLVAPESLAIPKIISLLKRGKVRTQLKQGALVGFLVLGVGLAGILYSRNKTTQAPEPKSIVPRESVRGSGPQSAASSLGPPVSSIRFDVPRGIRIYLDGKRVAGPQTLLRNQRVGKHKIRLEKDGSTPIVKTIRVKENEPTLIRVR